MLGGPEVSSPPPALHHADPGLKTYVFRVGPYVRWGFKAPIQHDATLASGPRGFAVP